MLCRICVAQIQPNKTCPRSCKLYGPTLQHEPDHTDQKYICPAWQIRMMNCTAVLLYWESTIYLMHEIVLSNNRPLDLVTDPYVTSMSIVWMQYARPKNILTYIPNKFLKVILKYLYFQDHARTPPETCRCPKTAPKSLQKDTWYILLYTTIYYSYTKQTRSERPFRQNVPKDIYKAAAKNIQTL